MHKTNKAYFEFIDSEAPVAYTDALKQMDIMHSEVLKKDILGTVWFLEHNDVYTKGSSANDDDIIDAGSIPVIETGRGGKITYHGVGQRIIYPIINLKKLHKNAPDIRLYVKQLEEVIIKSLAEVGIDGYIVPERVGVWVKIGDTECKIAAIGIRVKKWVTYHGIAINISPDLSKFSGIVPCGLHGFGVCSLRSLGCTISMYDFDQILQKNFKNILI
jgi:lipoyl(octanoyl) transferase